MVDGVKKKTYFVRLIIRKRANLKVSVLNILNRYLELSKREKVLILVATCVLLPLMIYRLLFLTIHDYEQNLSKNNLKLNENINTVNRLGQELKYFQQRSQRKVQSLNKRINYILAQTRLKTKSRISIGDNPLSGQKLVLTLTDLNLSELVDLIYKIEHSSPVILIEAFDLSPSYQSDKRFRVNMSLSSK